MSDLKNFGMMIPSGSFDYKHKPDPKGVPIYDKCLSNGPCFCTGRCHKIIGYITDPEKIKEYHAAIDKLNNLLSQRSVGLNTLNSDGTTRIYSWEIKQVGGE